MLQDIGIYEDELRDLEEQVQELLESMQTSKGNGRSELYARAQEKMKAITKLLHQFNIDVRVLPEGSDKVLVQRKAQKHSEMSTQLRQQLSSAWKKAQEEDNGNVENAPDRDGRGTARKMVKNINDIQNTALQSLARSEALVSQTEHLGTDSADVLRQQTEQIKLIGSQLDDLETHIGRAKKELHAFGRRMATDRLILAFIILIFILLVVGLVIKFVRKIKGKHMKQPE